MPTAAEKPNIVETIDEQAGRVAEAAPDLAVAAAVFLGLIAVGWLVGRLLRAAVMRRGDAIHAGFVSRLPVFVFGFVGLLVVTDFLGAENLAAGLLAGGGATAIILGFAFREVGENLLAGLFLVFSRPFRIGDLVQSGGLPEGLVRGVDLRNTHIRTADGRDIFIPNAHVFNTPLVNFTRDGLRRPTFTIGVDYRDPAGGAVCAALLEAVGGLEGVLAHPEPQAVIVDLTGGWVLIEVQVWINTRESDFAAVRSAAMEACRQAVIGNGWTISSEVKTAVELHAAPAIETARRG